MWGEPASPLGVLTRPKRRRRVRLAGVALLPPILVQTNIQVKDFYRQLNNFLRSETMQMNTPASAGVMEGTKDCLVCRGEEGNPLKRVALLPPGPPIHLPKLCHFWGDKAGTADNGAWCGEWPGYSLCRRMTRRPIGTRADNKTVTVRTDVFPPKSKRFRKVEGGAGGGGKPFWRKGFPPSPAQRTAQTVSAFTRSTRLCAKGCLNFL